MIEKIILNYLEENLSVPVYMEVPEYPPCEFIVLEKTGTSVSNHIYSSMFAIQSYSASLLEAAELNGTVKTVMDNAIELDEICSSRLNTDYPYTDTASERYRYQAVYDVTHY